MSTFRQRLSCMGQSWNVLKVKPPSKGSPGTDWKLNYDDDDDDDDDDDNDDDDDDNNNNYNNNNNNNNYNNN
ncbi:hypothetical protein PoB_002122100 [Plakobranchus ocellatus]|uniref:Uncharacterized protein n=1 Tax=Plakobranchus ocellatus TaxID=259542 RepID=A0AAV3Z5X6_9GAST|nr:hypothetical protein PoB_002122100 [Plakobranchus ocellatus]